MRCKKTIDARSYPHDMLERLRRDAVKRVEEGESPEVVATGLGVNRRTIYRWLQAYQSGGSDALAAKPIPGAPTKLSAQEMQELAQLLREHTPLDFGFDVALWTLAIIGELIQCRFGVSLSESALGRMLKQRLGFSPQRPLYRAWQQDAELVAHWREHEYPKIAARAKREGALVMFADESGIRADHHAGTTWAPKGQTPVVEATGARYGFNMLSAISAKGHLRFMTIEGRLNGEVFCEFLRRLITGMDRKIFLVVDGHPAHTSKLTKQFVEDNAERLELFFLPGYAPQLNPDELVWGHVKARVAKATARTKVELKRTVYRALHRLQKLPRVVASFFHASTCRYASG
jgi:transposase